VSAFGGSSLDIDLNAHRGVIFLSGHNQRPQAWRFMDGGSEQCHVSRQGITVNEPNAYVECGVASFRILQALGITLDRFLADETLVEVLRPYRPHPGPASVLYPSRSHLAPPVEVFVDWVREQFPKLYGPAA
jgi:LysR family transcriptional regulator, regulator for bpeEF and oprC